MMPVCHTAYIIAEVGFKHSFRFMKEIASHGDPDKIFLIHPDESNIHIVLHYHGCDQAFFPL